MIEEKKEQHKQKERKRKDENEKIQNSDTVSEGSKRKPQKKAVERDGGQGNAEIIQKTNVNVHKYPLMFTEHLTFTIIPNIT